VDNELEVEGWYKDPFARHELRWFSAGTATNLVRDGDAITQDEPPDEPFDGPLVEAEEVAVEDETVRVDDWTTPDDPPSMYGVP
jgi:hypothetical protein